MSLALKPDPAFPGASNKCLKVLDVSYNPISEKSIKYFAEMMETNRTLEYLGLAKCHLEN
jgi:Ran GTPase-activating protein (RanGAP) involved in mRNA processing and transport